MICVVCRERIKTESEDFEEVGSIEFAHSECVEGQEVEKNRVVEKLKD